jgi:fatty-acyl-CoA synthase
VGVPDARLGEVGAAFVTLQGPRERGGADRVHQAPRANFRVPRYLAVVESFDAIGMAASGKVQKHRLREHPIERFGLAALQAGERPSRIRDKEASYDARD